MPPRQPCFWLEPLQPQRPACLSAQEQQWCAALPALQQPRYRSSRSQLRHHLANLLACDPLAVPLHSPPGQAPRLEAGFGFVSISHSQQQLLTAWSPWPIGVDLEWEQRALQAEPLACRFFPPREWQHLAALAPEARRLAVLESWVRKEAAIKWRGSGIAQDLRHWYWDGERAALIHLQQGWQPTSLCQRRQGWLCGLVGEAVCQGIWG